MRTRTRLAGFTLLPVMLAMSLIAAIAFLMNRDNGMNAEMVGGQSDQDRARYAAEAGLQAVNAKVQSLSCAGGFPSIGTPHTNSSFGGASYSAYASPTSGNTTSLTSTGTYNGTSVTLTRNNIYVYKTAPSTYTLQPNPTAGIDTYIEFNNNKNFGNSNVMWGYPNLDYPMVKFDLSMFPAGALPLVSTLSLFQNSGATGTGNVSLQRMSNAWVEGTGSNSPLDGATWNTSDGSTAWPVGGYYHPQAVTSVAYASGSNIWVDFDTTDIATAWLLGRYPNHGVIALFSAGVGSVKYQSSDEANAARRPKMIINYLCPCGQTCPTDAPPPPTIVTLTSVADAHIDENAGSNQGTGTAMAPRRDATGKEGRAVVRFDSSSIPAGSTVTAAKLRLYLASSFGSGTFGYGVYRITSSWTEATATFALGYDAATQLALLNINLSSTGVWYEWTIPPALIQEWVDGISPNYGVLVRYESTQKNRTAYFSTRETIDIPQLVISYIAP
jgi:Tfp pilus assembly protein PilX